MFPTFPTSPTSVTTVAQIIQLAVAPVFLLAGIGAFLNVCAGRLSRIVDRARQIEPLLLASRGGEHDRWLREIRVLDRRMALVSQAIFLSVLAAVLICAVVVLLFAAGLTLNARSDRTLRLLRRSGGGYRIPQGGGFRYVSSPNYLGEMIEWTGWAIATWSLAGTAFALYTFANLAPRAFANHRWYRETFPDYPPERRALLPFVL